MSLNVCSALRDHPLVPTHQKIAHCLRFLCSHCFCACACQMMDCICFCRLQIQRFCLSHHRQRMAFPHNPTSFGSLANIPTTTMMMITKKEPSQDGRDDVKDICRVFPQNIFLTYPFDMRKIDRKMTPICLFDTKIMILLVPKVFG